MKRFLTLFFLTVIVLYGSIFALRALSVSSAQILLTHISSNSSALSPTPTPFFFIPNRLIIKKLGINALVESVGMDAQGRMDVPKDADNVAWYNLGYMPGEEGSAVIAGHLDRSNGSPAVFYKLATLAVGDTIEVERDGKKLTFEVVETAVFDALDFPIKRVFERTDAKYLNLITCDGTYDTTKKNYTKRYVVFSKLKTD